MIFSFMHNKDFVSLRSLCHYIRTGGSGNRFRSLSCHIISG